MKRIIYLLSLFLFAVNAAWADDISVEQAISIAQQFVSHDAKAKALGKTNGNSVEPRLAHAVKSKSSQKDNVYVINLGDDQGFVIVAGDDGADAEVLGYCDHGTFEYDKAPVQFKDLLANYSAGVDSLRQNQVALAKSASIASAKAALSLPEYMGSVVVGPLLTTTWGQSAPYNYQCPEGCPTGCGPTAISQILRYWRWPTEYDWDNMLDSYSEENIYSDVQANAVAKLMADVGKAFGTTYSSEGSGTYLNYIPFINSFGYEPNIGYESGMSGEDLIQDIKKDLNEHRPVLYEGMPENPKGEKSGHFLVIDGYTINDYFHFNYGWEGLYDGWYKNAVCDNFGYRCTILTGIRPYDAEKITIDDIQYGILSNGTAEILGYDKEDENNIDLVIPNTITDSEGKEYKVERIRTDAFSSCNCSFKTVTLGDNIKHIDRFAFINNEIETLIIGDKSEVVSDNAFEATGVKNLIIGASVKHIGDKAFYACQLENVTCKSPAITVGKNAFTGCSIDCGEWLDHITEIGEESFSGVSFRSMPHFRNVTKIGSKAFSGSNGLNELFIIYPSVKNIAPDAFVNCSASRVKVDDGNPYFALDGYGMIYNKSKTSLVIATNYLSLLTEDTYPETMIRMGEGSINPRRSDASGVTIPNSVEDVTGAFTLCGKDIGTITCLTAIPPVATYATFNDEMFEANPERELHVPAGCENIYRNAPGWSRFNNIIADQPYVLPPSQPDRQYFMILHCSDKNQQSLRIPVGSVKDIRVGDYVSGMGASVFVSQDDADNAYRVDSITWMRGFAYDNAEVFKLSPDNLVAKAQNCTVTLSPTILEEEVELAIRESVSLPARPEGTLRSLAFDISFSNGQHELEGVAQIVIPFSVKEGNRVQAGYYDEESGEWKPVLAIYDEHRQELTIYTNHFTQFCALEVEDLATTCSMITGLDCYETTLSLIEVLNHAKEILTEGKDPDTEAIDKWKDEASFWQSIGIDGGYSVLQGLGFSADHVDKAVGIVGWLGTAMTFFDLIRASYNDDNLGVAVNSLKVINSVSAAYIGTVVGTQLLSLSMGGLAFVGIALEKFGTKMQERKKDYIRGVYRLYYSEMGNDIAGKKVCLSTKDWRKKLYPLFKRPDMNMDRLNLLIEAYVRQYTEAFWREDNDVYTWLMGAYTEMKKPWDFTSFLNVRESEQKEISEEFFAELMNGQMVSVIQAIKSDLEYEQWVEYQKYMEQFAAFMNSKIGIDITDSSCKEGEASVYDGWTIRFTEVPSGIEDKHRLVTTINSEGRARMGYYTLHSFITNKIKRQLTLVDPYGEEQRTYDFDIPGAEDKTIIEIDLAGGKEINTIDRLSIEHRTNNGASSSGRALSTLVEFDADYIAVYEDYSGEQKHVKRNQKYKVPLYAYIGYNDDTLYNLEIQNTNFKKEIERFFREHETIFVDDEGNYTIGKDIKGTFAHNSRSASGKFIINTSYEFEEKSIQEFISAWKSADWGRMANIMLNGTINHQIECDYVITRNADGTVYQIDYQGEGTFDLVANGVKRFHRDFGEIPYFSVLFYYDEDFLDITEDNLTVGPLVFYQGSGSRRDAANYTDEHGRGTVKLQYTKKIKVNK